jgi:hypothetical protein
MSSRAKQSAQRARQPEQAQLPKLALLPVIAIAVALTAVLVAFAGRYGYLGDELYFVACGKHLAWGYPDQPPFVPLVARGMSDLAPGSLVVLRLPSALAAGVLVVLTGLLTRELRGGRTAQTLACAVTALALIVTGSEHVVSTFGFELPAAALLCWLLLRILRTREEGRGGGWGLWLAAGLVAGAGLLDTDLVAFLVFAFVVGLAVAGPRLPLRSGWFYAGGAIALAMWSPYLAWQAAHGWPELAVSRSIAAGRSGTSTPWWAVLPGQLELISLWFAPVWITGLVRLLRDPGLRWCRAVGVAYLVLVVAFMATGGKDYYLSVLAPVLFAAGAQPTVDWLGRGHVGVRRGLLAVALVLSVAELVATLPIVPVSAVHKTSIVKSNNTVGQTIGWPAFTAEIAQVYRSLPAAQRSSAVVLASNYSEAGAVDRFGPADGLSAAYSRQDAFWYWGPPPATAATVVAVGFDKSQLGFCRSLRQAAILNNHVDVSNADQGDPVYVCTQLSASLPSLWLSLRYLG